jgi:hypothetical protein
MKSYSFIALARSLLSLPLHPIVEGSYIAFDCSNCRSHLGCKSVIWSLLTELEPPRYSLVTSSCIRHRPFGIAGPRDISRRRAMEATYRANEAPGGWVYPAPTSCPCCGSTKLVEPNFQILRRYRRSLLLRLEHSHRSPVENHVHRAPRLGSRRLLNLRIGITRCLWDRVQAT